MVSVGRRKSVWIKASSLGAVRVHTQYDSPMRSAAPIYPARCAPHNPRTRNIASEVAALVTLVTSRCRFMTGLRQSWGVLCINSAVSVSSRSSYAVNAAFDEKINDAWYNGVVKTYKLQITIATTTMTKYPQIRQLFHSDDKLLFTTNGSNYKYNKIHNWKWLN